MKEKAQAALEKFRPVSKYVFNALFVLIPVSVLPLPDWAYFTTPVIIYIALTFMPTIGGFLHIVLWIAAFIFALRSPAELFSIIFFIAAAVFLAYTLIPIVRKRKDRKK